MLIAHLSDLHLRDSGDVEWLDRQLTRIAARRPDHLAITGDLLDRWDPALLEKALDALSARGLLHADRLTLLHGNHDLASSGGHPRRSADLWRLALRFWDPPPLIKWRRRHFYAAIASRFAGVARVSPWVKSVAAGFRVAVLDTVPLPWWPVVFDRGALEVQHAVGCVRSSESEWLAAQRGDDPLVVLTHHYPLETQAYRWKPNRNPAPGPAFPPIVREVRVPMAIPAAGRERLWQAAHAANVRLLLCGHVHRARLDTHEGIAVGLNGQSGAEWAGRTIAFYEVGADSIEMRSEQVG